MLDIDITLLLFAICIEGAVSIVLFLWLLIQLHALRNQLKIMWREASIEGPANKQERGKDWVAGDVRFDDAPSVQATVRRSHTRWEDA